MHCISKFLIIRTNWNSNNLSVCLQVRSPSSSEGAPVTVLCAGELPLGLLGLILPSNVLLMSFRLSCHLVTLHQELCAQSQLQGEMKITWIVQTYSVSLCCTPKHSLGLQDTSNCWCGDACPDKLFLENNQLGSNLAY